MKKTTKISIISFLAIMTLVAGAFFSFNNNIKAADLSGTAGVQIAGGDKEYDPCANPSSGEYDTAGYEACGGGGGGGGYNPPYQPPQQENPLIVATSEVVVYVKSNIGDTTGTITADRSSCIIEDGKNTCDAKFTWSVTNPDPEKVATVKRAPVDGPVINQNSGSEILPVYYWLSESDTTRYVLFIDKVYTEIIDGEKGKILDQVFVKATCKTGSSWVSSLNQCVKNVSVNKFSTSNCIIPEGGSSCNANISWEVGGGIGNFAVTTPNNIIVASGKSGNTTYGVEYPSRDFYLYNNGKELSKSTSYADCVSGSTWDSSLNKCISSIALDKTPRIAIWANHAHQHTENGVWTTDPDGSAYAVVAPDLNTEEYRVSICRKYYGNNIKSSPEYKLETITTWMTRWNKEGPFTTENHQSYKCSEVPIDPQECLNGATNPPLCTIFPPQECTNGASNPPECNLFGTLSKFEVKDCSIKSNESTCQTKLNWASTLSGSFGITTPEQITVSAASSGTDVPYTVEYPSRKFFAYNNGNLVEEKVAYAKCEEGNIWSMTDNKCVSEMLCAGELERDIYFDCPVGYEGKIIRKQFKTFPGCIFEDPATEENTVLINNNCRSKDDPDPQWKGRSCNECSEGVEQVYCTETNENGDVREFIMNCPGDGGGGGSGQSVLNIEIKATPEKIMKGRLSTITWSSNADSCRAIPVPGYLNDFNTGEGNRPNGFDTVKPLSNNLYKIECTKGEITESKMIEVKVSSLNIIEL